MSLFISNFRSEAKVLVGAILAVLAVECGLRVALPHISVDFSHIETIPSIARSFGDHSRPRVLFLGNSLTRRGVDLNVVESTWADMGIHATTRSVYPDDTTMIDWYYLFEHYFPPDHAPDLVVIGFVRSQVSDQTAVHPNRIAAHFGGFGIANEVLTTDLTDFGDKVDFLLSTKIRMFSERDRLRETILRALVPRYSETAQALNVAALKAKEAGEVHFTYGRLTRFLRMCRERGTLPLFVAMPLPAPYEIDKELVTAVTQQGGLLWDFRDTYGLTQRDFVDALHLAPSGALIYTKRLAPALASLDRVRAKGVLAYRTEPQ